MQSEGILKQNETLSEFQKIDNQIFQPDDKILISKKGFKPRSHNDSSLMLTNENKSMVLRDDKTDLFTSYSKISKLISENSNFVCSSGIFSDRNKKKLDEKDESSISSSNYEIITGENNEKSEVQANKSQSLEKKVEEKQEENLDDLKAASLVQFFQRNFKYCLDLYRHEQVISLMSSQISLLSHDEICRISGLVCCYCRGLMVEISLLCGHQVCMSCFKRNVDTFISAPSLLNLKQLSCKVCLLNYGLQDMLKYSESVEKFKSISLEIHCERCNESFQAIFNYWTESPCFHLCASCYADLLMININYCLFCNKAFQFRSSSLQRFSDCASCGTTENSVMSCHRNVQGFKCFACLQQLAEKTIEKSLIPKIARYINKTCHVCSKLFNICDVQFQSCEHIICESCLSSPEKRFCCSSDSNM